MSRESLIEIKPPDYQFQTGQVQTGALPSNTLTDALGGGTFGTDFVVGDLITWIDDAGKAEAGVVDGVAANALTVKRNVQSVASGGATNLIYRLDSIPPYFYPVTIAPQAYVRSGFAGRGGGVGSGDLQIAQTEAGRSKIDSNEGILIKSIYMRAPYQFTMADGWIGIEILAKITGASGVPSVVDEIGENGIIQVPTENMEIPVNQYVNPLGIAGQTWQLYLRVSNPIPIKPPSSLETFPLPLAYATMSTVDMPAILEYTFQPIIIGARIVHAQIELAA